MVGPTLAPSLSPSLLALRNQRLDPLCKDEPPDALRPVPSRQPLSSSPSTGSRSTAPVLAAAAPALRLRLDSEQTAALHRHIPALAATVREIVKQRQPAQLVIDLSELAPGPLLPGTGVFVCCAAPDSWYTHSDPPRRGEPRGGVVAPVGIPAEGVTIVATRHHPHPTRVTETIIGIDDEVCTGCNPAPEARPRAA
ncbi:MAG: hypothetical protein M3460_28650 [Actinomycetota bacterium]|nr:hypothetical protein [Actinomycetota bacterium]